MKNLPCIIASSALISLVLVTIAASLIDSFPYVLVVTHIIGFSGGAGLLSLFLADYAPRSCDAEVPAAQTERKVKPVAPPVVRQRGMVVSTDHPFGALTDEAMATLGMCNDPATLSLT